MFHSFFSFLARSRYLYFSGFFKIVILWSAWMAKSTIIIIIYLMVFHRSLSDNKSLQVSWTLFGILTDLNNAVVWSPFVLLFLSPPVAVPIFWWLYRARQLLLGSPSLLCSTVFIIIITIPLEFFTSADGLSLVFTWQQVLSSLQDSSQYSGRS